MKPTLRLGLVGCGRLAEVGHVPAIARTPGVALAACADPDPARTTAVAVGSPGPVATFDDVDAMLTAGGIDAVVVASPVAFHVEAAEAAARAGLPVLVEKPPAPDAAGAARLAALGPGVSVGFNRRFDPGAVAVRSAVPSTGRLDLRARLRYRRASWGAHRVRDEVLLDLGPHLVDWARWITGRAILDVRTEVLRPDRAVLRLRLEDATAELSARADGIHAEALELTDGRGARLASHRAGGLVAAVAGRLRPPAGHPLVDSLAAQLAAFHARVTEGAPSELATADDGVAAMAAIDAARRSERAGQPVAVDPPSPVAAAPTPRES